MIRIRISGDALSDLNDGFWFYEARNRALVTTSSHNFVRTSTG